MSLLNQASLVVTPNAYKASKLYSVIPSDGSGDLTVTRATTATRVNASGLIESIAANVSRLDYTNASCPSILVEPQRTNLILNSATGTNQSVTTTAIPFTLSFYGTGTVTLSGSHSATIVGTGTTRKTYTFTPSAGVLIITISGTTTNLQLEEGSYATSYVPTTTTSVTRNADVISKTGISGLIGQTEGTVFLDYIWNNNLEDIILFSIYGNNSKFMWFRNNGVQFYGNSSNLLFNSDIISNQNQRYKLAFVYGQNYFKLFINGSLIASSTSGTFSGTFDDIKFSPIDSSPFNESIKHNVISLFKNKLTDNECITLTTL